MDPTFAGIIEAWALGVSWSELLTLTSVQEGDLIRLLRRVLDMLRQIPRLPFVPNDRGASTALRLNARRAVTLMDRFPVSDDVTYTVSEEELMSGMTSEGLQTDMKLPKGEVKRAEVMGWEDGEVSEVLEGEDLYVQSRGSSYSDDAEAVDAEWTPGSDDEAGEYDDDEEEEEENEDEDEDEDEEGPVELNSLSLAVSFCDSLRPTAFVETWADFAARNKWKQSICRPNNTLEQFGGYMKTFEAKLAHSAMVSSYNVVKPSLLRALATVHDEEHARLCVQMLAGNVNPILFKSEQQRKMCSGPFFRR